MSDLKTVYLDGEGMLVSTSVMELLRLKEGQDITEDVMWQCIELSAAEFVGAMKALRNEGVEVPNTDGLESQLMISNERRYRKLRSRT